MQLRERIERAFDNRAALAPGNAPAGLTEVIDECLALLGSGRARVAEPDGQGGWTVNEWLKKAVLLHFRTHDNVVSAGGDFRWFDKVPLKHADYDLERFRADGARIVPGAIVRTGAHIGRDVVLMPSFVNVGAYVGEGTMVDTWATVGSCAQIGRNVHLSGGVGIGGVLEPLQARPTIIEEDCFVGARSEVVEGVIVGTRRGAVDGRVHRREHADLRPRDARGQLRLCPGRLGRGAGQPACGGRLAFPRLRRHRQESRRADPRENFHQRTAPDIDAVGATRTSPGGTPLARAGTLCARSGVPRRSRTRTTAAHDRRARPARTRPAGCPSERIKFRRERGDTPPGSRARQPRASAADTVKSHGCQPRLSSRRN